jgi:CRP/FNR family cyclic AMP-dependent transcriptional regulator
MALKTGRKLQSGPSLGSGKRMSRSKPAPATKTAAVIDWADVRVQRVEYAAKTTIFAQGDPATSVMYVEQGTVRLSVLSHAGKEAVIAVLEADHFFGEGCLVGQPLRMVTASAISPCTIIVVEKGEMALISS